MEATIISFRCGDLNSLPHKADSLTAAKRMASTWYKEIITPLKYTQPLLIRESDYKSKDGTIAKGKTLCYKQDGKWHDVDPSGVIEVES